MNDDIEEQLYGILKSPRSDCHAMTLARAVLATRKELRQHKDRPQSSPRIEIMPSLVDPDLIAKLTSERDQYKHDFATMSERAAELAFQVEELTRKLDNALRSTAFSASSWEY